MITWWEVDQTGKAQQIELLIQIKDGFTRHLAGHPSISTSRVYIEGPYGAHHDYGDFGNVLLLATGAGIASQIPFAKQLIEGHQRHEIRTRRISLVWQLDREGNENWVQAWMQNLLDMDGGSYVSF